MKDEITKQLKEIIAEQLDVNIQVDEIEDDVALLEEGLGLDSIVIMELITLVEENFGFHFEEDDLNMEHFLNMQTLSQFIVTKLDSQPAVWGY